MRQEEVGILNGLASSPMLSSAEQRGMSRCLKRADMVRRVNWPRLGWRKMTNYVSLLTAHGDWSATRIRAEPGTTGAGR